MTLPKSYLIDYETEDGSIEAMHVKATSRDKALQIFLDAHGDRYANDTLRRQEFRKHFRQFRDRDSLTRNRPDCTGQYRLQHKGKKRRGVKNYPAPKRGWRKYSPPVTFTWKEDYSVSTRKYMESRIKSLQGIAD